MIAWSRLDLGVGLIACGGVDLVWPSIVDLVDVVEVEPQTLWDPAEGDGRRLDRRALRWLRSLERPMLSHGVGFPWVGRRPPRPAAYGLPPTRPASSTPSTGANIFRSTAPTVTMPVTSCRRS